MDGLSKPLDGDRNKGPAYLAVALTFCGGGMSVCIITEMYVHLGMIKSRGWDDVFICVALVS